MALDFLQIFEMLPVILNAAQILIYVFMAWFFGSVSMKGMKMKLGFPIRIALSFGLGFGCVLIGSVLFPSLNMLQDSFSKGIQIDFLAGGLASSVIFVVCLYLASRESGREGPEAIIKKLRKRIGMLEEKLMKSRASPIPEKDAYKIASEELGGYQPKEARLNKGEWYVLLEKGEKKAGVVMGAYDGFIKKIEHEMSLKDRIISNPLRIAGIAVILILVVFAFLSFRGLPTIMDSVESLTGFDLGGMGLFPGGDPDLPEGCVSASNILMASGANILNLPTYTDDAVSDMFEEETGQKVVMMFETDYGSRDFIIGITIPADIEITGMNQEDLLTQASFCSATQTQFCDCVSLSG